MSYECRLLRKGTCSVVPASQVQPSSREHTRPPSQSGRAECWGRGEKKCLGCLEISEILLYYAIISVKESRTMPGLSEPGFAQEKFAKSDFFAYLCNSKRDKRNYNE